MNNNNTEEKRKHKVGQYSYKFNNLLTITSYVEIKQSNQQSMPLIYNILFLEFSKKINNTSFSYDIKNKKSITMSTFEVRQLIYGLKELYKTKKSDFTNYKNSSLSQNTEDRELKQIKLSYNLDSSNFFINFSLGKDKESLNTFLNKYELLALCDSLKLMCDNSEEQLYKLQLKYHEMYRRKLEE